MPRRADPCPKTARLVSLAVFAAAACGSSPDKRTDTDPPRLASSAPAAGAQRVGVNSALVLRFSEAMVTTSVQVTLAPPVALGAPSWNAAGTEVTIPLAAGVALGSSTTYTVSVSGTDVTGLPLAAGTGFSFTAADVLPPGFSSDPADGAAGQPVGRSLVVRFGEPMDPATASLTLDPAAALSAPTWNAAQTEATFALQQDLLYSTSYQATVAGQDLQGNPVSAGARFAFTTAPVTVATASFSPAGAAGLVGGGSILTVAFSAPVERGTVSVRASTGGAAYDLGAATWAPGGASVIFAAPPARLPLGGTCTVEVDGKDALGGTIQAAARSFDVEPQPTLTSTPADAATGVPVDQAITLVFNVPMDEASVAAALSITGSAPPFACQGGLQWSPDDTVATCTPTPSLANSASYGISLGASARSRLGDPLAPAAFGFATVPPNQPPAVSSSIPAETATFVIPPSAIVVTFTKPVKPLTAQAAFSAKVNGAAVTGRFDATGTTMTWTPSTPIPARATVSWTLLPNTVEDTSVPPLAMAAAVTRSFKTYDRVSTSVAADAALSGWADNSPSLFAHAGTNALIVGDGSRLSGKLLEPYGVRGFLSFPLALPAGAVLRSASVAVPSKPVVAGSPASLGAGPLVESVAFAALDASAYALKPLSKQLEFQADKGLPVTELVAADLRRKASFSQLRVSFPQETNGDAVADTYSWAPPTVFSLGLVYDATW